MPTSDLDRLYEFCLPFAKEQLGKRDWFDPFAATVKSDGNLCPIAIYEGQETPRSEEMANKLAEILRNLARQGDILASAVCYNGLVSVPAKENQKAIMISMERAGGVVVSIAIPYSWALVGGYDYEAAFRIAAEPWIFA
jgi:hypothetical protein